MRFIDEDVRRLNTSDTEDFVELIRLMCGRDIKPEKQETTFLSAILSQTSKLNYEQFNEILLVLNQERVSSHFFDFFFRAEARAGAIPIGRLKEGIEKFRGFAMLEFGNFRFAYQKLSSVRTPPEEFKRRVTKHCILPTKDVRRRFCDRPLKSIRISPIEKERTWLLGYLSAGKYDEDSATFLAILSKVQAIDSKDVLEWKERILREDEYKRYRVKDSDELLQNRGKEAADDVTRRVRDGAMAFLRRVKKKAKSPSLDASKWLSELPRIVHFLEAYRADYSRVRELGKRNTDVYLTWDYMDVYVATSMRERWEYEACFDFLRQVFKRKGPLKSLKLRYFDPTQSYTTNRIDKGLVEGLMLKRASCTLYLAQETDTLGKDSELASTLAQGKPVIAYVPEVKGVKDHARRISKLPLDYIRKRWLQLEADEFFTIPECQSELAAMFGNKVLKGAFSKSHDVIAWKDQLFLKFREATSRRTFNLFENEEKGIKSSLGKHFFDLCTVLAIVERHYFNKRALTLRETHPLAIQVHLTDGVAHGVLVVRSAEQCAKILYGILTNKLLFSIKHPYMMTELREKISNSPYRVVTEDRKLTNSFWNFYLTPQMAV